MELKVNDRVKISVDSRYYSYNEDTYNPKCEGTLKQVGDCEFKYHVLWDNQEYNSYKEGDLEFVLPEKWCIRPTEKTKDILQKWFNDKMKRFVLGDYQSFYHFPEVRLGVCTASSIHEGYTEITFETFKKYVLKEMKTYKLTKQYPGSGELGITTTEDMSNFPEFWEEVRFKLGDIVLVQTYSECGEGNGISKEYNICEIVTKQKATGLCEGQGEVYVKPINSKLVYRVRESHIIRKATSEEIHKAQEVIVGTYRAEKRKEGIKFGCQIITEEEIEIMKKMVSAPINADITIHGTKITLELLNRL